MKYASIACLTLAVVPVFALPSPSGPLAVSGDDIESHPAVAAREPLENDLEALANSLSHPGPEKDPRDFKEGAVLGLMLGTELMPMMESGGNAIEALGVQNLLPSGSQNGATSSGGSLLGFNLRNVPRDQSDEEQTELLAEGNGRALIGTD